MATAARRNARKLRQTTHQARENLVPARVFLEIMEAHDLTTAEAARRIDRTPARVRELTRRFGGSPRTLERFVLAVNDR